MVKICKWDFPEELLYDQHHQWIAQTGNKIQFGLTPYGIEITGDVLYLALPAAGTEVVVDNSCGSLEAGKWVGRIYAPVSGRVTRINQAIVSQPGCISKEPYFSWFMEIELSQPEELKKLMTVHQVAGWLLEEMKQDA